MSLQMINAPGLWSDQIPVPGQQTHKYARGGVVILGGDRLTGAARLASEAAMRMGAGLCTIVTSSDAQNVYREAAPHIMVEVYKTLAAFPDHLHDPRRNTVLIGPGAGLDDPAGLQTAVLGTLALPDRHVVVDADGLSVFASNTAPFFARLHDTCILTPHEGEFDRIFGDLTGDKPARARMAAKQSGAIILLKGAKTIIAHPDGRVVINDHASPFLATAGSGDVLAGMITGLLAQGMPPFWAACAGAWIHGEAGCRLGPGLVAPDLVGYIPVILQEMIKNAG